MRQGSRQTWRNLALSAGILALAAVLFALLVATRPETREMPVQERAWPVAAITLKPGRWPRTLSLFARVDALSRSTVTAAVAAEVRTLEVVEGQSVRAGQLLATLDDRDYRLDLEQRKAELEQARAAVEQENSRHRGNLEALPRERRLLQLAQAEVDRLEDLLRKKLTSQSSLDSARQAWARQAIAVSRIEESVRSHESRLRELQARVRQKEAAVARARLQLERTRVKAPYDGRVIRLMAAPGQRLAPGGAVVELYATDSLVLRAVVPEPHLETLGRMASSGAPVEARGRLDGRTVSAAFLGLSAAVAGSGAGVEALFRLAPDSRWLQLGRVLEVQVELPPLDGVVPIPWEALYGGDEIYLIDGENRLHAVRVERVGRLRRDGRELLLVRAPGLEGARLLATQLPNAVEGLLVKVVEQRDG